MKAKKFKSTKPEGTRIALLSGHIFMVSGSDWTNLPEIAHSQAYALGCISEDMVANLSKGASVSVATIDPVTLAEDVLKDALAENDTSLFGSSGNPLVSKMRLISNLETLTGAQLSKAWSNVQETLPVDNATIEAAEKASDELPKAI